MKDQGRRTKEEKERVMKRPRSMSDDYKMVMIIRFQTVFLVSSNLSCPLTRS